MNAVLTALIPYLVPIIVIIVGYFYHLVYVHIPAQQRAYIEAWAKIAVAMVEQKFANQTDEQKKQFAVDALKDFFLAFHLPCPPDAILSAFIDAAVNALLQGGKA